MKLSTFRRLTYTWCVGMLLSSVCHAALSKTPSESAQSGTETIQVVAAQRVYGDVIEQLGGSHVQVVNLATQLNQDPHLLTTTPKIGRQLTAARLVAYNGADYDAWLQPLLAASHTPERTEISVAALIGKRSGDNPHIWYLPEALPAFAHAVHAFLKSADPTHAKEYDARLKGFLTSLEPIQKQITALRARYKGIPITATEPVFDYMAEAIGLEMRQQSFQRAVMMESPPSAKDIIAFQNDLQHHHVKLLIYNTQTSGDMARHMLTLARKSCIPVLLITETLPEGLSYQHWILQQLQTLNQNLALNGQTCVPSDVKAPTAVPSL